MSYDDDEFKDVEKGLPAENTAQRSSVKFLLIFLVGGIIITFVISQFSGTLGGLMGSGRIMPQVLMTGATSLLLGGLQAWVFKSKIRSRVNIFVIVSVLGGLIGGLVGGLLLNSGLEVPIIVGAVNGALAGGISSLVQNRLMGNQKYGSQWFSYNIISWACIFAIAWLIGWSPLNTTLIALAGGFLMVASGISLVAFLRRTPQIEFS
jgi:hypothetical protein